MYIAYYLVDALPPIAAGIVALWAANSNWHWFARASVVIVGLLALLLIPAYELVIAFGTEMLTIVVGMTIWKQRRRRSENFDQTRLILRYAIQISLKSLLLLMVFVAVVVAVLARFPSLNWFSWISQAASGLIAGVLTLLCVWIVLGKARRWIRVAAALLIWIVAGVGISIVELATYGLWYSVNGSVKFLDYILSPESQVWMWDRSQYWLATIAIALSVLCAWLFLWVRSGWYAPFAKRSDQSVAASSLLGRATWGRGTFLTMSFAVLILPLYLFWRLLTPPPYSRELALMPSEYPELMSISQMIDEATVTRLIRHNQMSDGVLTKELAAVAPAIARMRRALSGPVEYTKRTIDDEEHNAFNLFFVVDAELDLANRKDSLERKLCASVDYLLLVDVFARDSAPEAALLYLSSQAYPLRTLWECRRPLPRDQAKEVAMTLWELDRRRIPWQKLEEQLKHAHLNSGWESHLQLVLDDWNGYDRFSDCRLRYLRDVAQMRVLIGDLAIQAFHAEHNRLPEWLAELAPNYLPSVPLDPFLDDVPLIYRDENGTAKLYSVGPNLQDDGGHAFDANTNEGDIAADSLFLLPAGGSATATTGKVSAGAESAVVDEKLDAADSNSRHE